MALKDQALEFDVDDAVLLMETPIHFDQKDKVTKAASAGRPKAASSTRQHKFIDYNRALDATQLYLNEIGFSPS